MGSLMGTWTRSSARRSTRTLMAWERGAMEEGDEAQEWQGEKGWGTETEIRDMRKDSQSFLFTRATSGIPATILYFNLGSRCGTNVPVHTTHCEGDMKPRNGKGERVGVATGYKLTTNQLPGRLYVLKALSDSDFTQHTLHLYSY